MIDRAIEMLPKQYDRPRLAAALHHVLVGGAVLATTVHAGATDLANSSPAMQQVEIRASSTMAARMDANAAKSIISRDDIMRFADSSVADVLRRVPGVTVGGGGSQLQDIRMRGLGNGYTQMLVNGEPLPDGFSLSALSPEMIERIEIIRSATADMSTQSIAGTINIILRRSASAPDRAIKVNASAYSGIWSGGAVGQWSDRSGASTYGLSSALGYDRNRLPSTNVIGGRDETGGTFSRITGTMERNTQWKLDAVPRFGWQSEGQQQLSIDGLLQAQHHEYRYDDMRGGVSGKPPVFMSDSLSIVNDLTQIRATVQWKSPVAQRGRLETKVTLSGNRRLSDALLTGADGASRTILSRTIRSVLQDNGLIVAGKYALRVGESNTLSLGWDGQYGRRSENRIQRDSSATGFPLQDLDEDYDATVSRLALYAQDEFELSSRLSGYLGLRWEALETKTAGRRLALVSNRFDVLSPTFQLLWKVPSSKVDQLRIALGRTYKAPTTKDLIPRRWVVMDNSATTPNFQGNPDLRPELSWGLDVGYEHYTGDAGFAGLSVYARHIGNVLQQRVYKDRGVWVLSPYNNGAASVYGVELEAKLKTRELSRSAPDVDLSTGLTRNWSSVQNVQGPGNRVSQQAPLTAAIAADYRPTGKGMTLGASFHIETGAFSRSSLQESAWTNTKRRLDVYGLYQAGKDRQLRVTVSNILNPDDMVETRYDDDFLMQEQVVRERSHCTVRVQFEMKL